MPKFLLCAVLLGFASLFTARADIDLTKPLDLKFTAIDGTQVDLAKLRGKVVLIDFWATWCPPCQAISPDIAATYKKYHSQGLEIIGISGDSDKAALMSFVRKHGDTWPQYFDESGEGELMNRFSIQYLPTLILVDKKGMIVTTSLYSDTWYPGGEFRPGSPEVIAKLDAKLEKLLQAP